GERGNREASEEEEASRRKGLEAKHSTPRKPEIAKKFTILFQAIRVIRINPRNPGSASGMTIPENCYTFPYFCIAFSSLKDISWLNQRRRRHYSKRSFRS